MRAFVGQVVKKFKGKIEQETMNPKMRIKETKGKKNQQAGHFVWPPKV